MRFWTALTSLWLATLVFSSPYRPDLVQYNFNVNQDTTDPTQYYSTRTNKTYTPSPQNWRAVPMGLERNPTSLWRRRQGLASKLDYIQGMGMKAIYLSGTIFLNMIWEADSYSPLDFSVSDPHWGTIADWIELIDTIHSRGMYIILDFTVGTMSDLLSFQGYLNVSAPFDINEYDVEYTPANYMPWNFTEYADFTYDNTRNTSCQLPVFYNEDSTIDFDQYGDMEAFGVHPDWQRQLSKFASVQDRLREWNPAVMAKLPVFSCMVITALDIDGIRVDKATQVTVDGMAAWAAATRQCATKLGKSNFLIAGEVTGGDIFGALYLGRGRTQSQLPPGFQEAANLTESDNQYFLRNQGDNGLDGYAFHYSIYRSLTRFLGMDGNLQVAYDLDTNFITAWNQMFVNDDFLNANNGILDPRHWYGTSNFDVFRWPSLENGTLRAALGSFITNMVMPGIALWRQAMFSNKAWQRHGCYKLGSAQYFNMPLESALMGCEDDWNSLDHFDPTTDMRRLTTQFLYLRSVYDSLQDGLNLRPGSNGTATEMGLWSISRAGLAGIQNLTGTHTDQVWLLYSNLNTSLYVVVRLNLLAPYENYTLAQSGSSYYNNGTAPYYGCMASITLDPYGMKVLVPDTEWVSNATTLDLTLEFNLEMSCTSVTNSLTLNMSSSGIGGQPTLDTNSITCTDVTNPVMSTLAVAPPSAWSWSGTLNNVPDGILEIIVNNPTTADGTASTGSVDHLLVRKGSADNIMVFPESDYDDSALEYTDGEYKFTHKAYGADMFRYSGNFGRSWSNWTNWENVTVIPTSVFSNSSNFWAGQHIMVQYWNAAAASASVVLHADLNYNSQRRVPQFLARGPYNQWGYDQGLPSLMNHVNVFGYDDYYYGDVDGDGVMDRLPPNTIAPNYLNMSAPPWPALSWSLTINDQTLEWSLQPLGDASFGAIMFGLLASIPLITGIIAASVFMWSFYGIRHNRYGIKSSKGASKYIPILGSLGNRSLFGHRHTSGEIIGWPEDKEKRRKVLISTLEYEIFDWKAKVKIGGLGVMSSLMGKAMTDVDLIWVVPKVKDVEYPPGDPAEPIEVIIFGEPYLIEVETHVLDNITWVILDSPVFRAQTKSDPYPPRMDDLSSAIFYSTWNQAIATTIRRFPGIDIYHINDYHGALAPIYLLPKVIPVCLSLHNAEFQGLWPLRTKEEMKEVCSAFNISKEHCTKYVQFGNTFNLLHAAASFISVHQKSVGVAGVSDKYGKRSWARYPALWTLKHVDSLPNPDPTDIAALDENPVAVRDIQIDQEAEAKRPELKRQAQEWAGIKQDPNADLFVFVGRWSKQKGVDLIADVMPSLLEKRPSIQLICVGPVIDLFGRFAAEKLARLMEIGADFALIPSRDEPFGLVAVEFGRKGALGVGSRLGGLGLMPGWWFPVESTSTAHMLSQLSKTIKLALKSTEEERAILRARSAVQRFPVIEWRQKMEDFHKRSIQASRRQAGPNAWRESDCGVVTSRPLEETDDWDPVQQSMPAQPDWDAQSAGLSPGFPASPLSQASTPRDETHLVAPPRFNLDPGSSHSDHSDDDYFFRSSVASSRQGYDDFLEKANRTIAKEQRHAPDPFLDAPHKPFTASSRRSSRESISTIVEDKTNSPLNKAIASFTDSDGGVAHEFAQKLQMLSADNSKGELSIEKFLTKSEEHFFDRVRKEKLSSAVSYISSKRESMWSMPGTVEEHSHPTSPGTPSSHPFANESGLLPPSEVVVMNRVQIALAREIGGWPLYTIIIALGQMLAANSYQMTLLSGQNYSNDLQLYVLGGVFLASSAVWYVLFRYKPSVYVLSLPWLFYGMAFFLIGIPALSSKLHGTNTILADIATWLYAVASAAAFAFFGLNFGEEAGASTQVWILRACIVQGSQQIWVAALWYWGSTLNSAQPGKVSPWWIVLIVWPLSILSFLFVYLMLYGLPDYYRQTPPKVPNFLKTLFRRKLVLWYAFSPYGRNWSFLWSVNIPTWQTLLLVIFFFIGVWALMLVILIRLSMTHTWLLPVFAVGLGAPRWCQILWGSAGPYLGLSLWLWLGVLDAVQGVGLGMILLQTLSRLHVCATLAFSQVIGAVWSPMASAAFWIALICQLIIVLGYFWFYRKEQLCE
ncbi:glycoside hydrolase family 13/glycosyltransferase family 5 protein [Pisolithus albus]|nr:glycoside hydrolase family 13/glycosyltransferase family 5 protein [Pisolithus albus]